MQQDSTTRVLTSAQMKQAEADAVANGTSYAQLMENAGSAAAREIEQIAEDLYCEKSILLLAGRGNNAGDAFVVARLLAQRGWQATIVLLCGREFSPLAAQNFDALPGDVKVLGSIEKASFAVGILCDGVFGTGFHGVLPPKVAFAFREVNRATAVRVALDVPSGLDPDKGDVAEDTFVAAHTLTFGAWKPAFTMAHTKGVCGEVLCLDIGL